MGVESAVRGEIFFHDVVYRGRDDPGLAVFLDVLQRNAEEIVKIFVMVILDGDQQVLIVCDILTVEFQFLDGMGALTVFDPDAPGELIEFGIALPVKSPGGYDFCEKRLIAPA